MVLRASPPPVGQRAIRTPRPPSRRPFSLPACHCLARSGARSLDAIALLQSTPTGGLTMAASIERLCRRGRLCRASRREGRVSACSAAPPPVASGSTSSRTSRPTRSLVHPADPNIVLAGTVDGVWRSTDRGETFKRANFPDKGKQVWSFLVDSRDSRAHLCRRLAGRRLSQRRQRRELAAPAQSRHQGPRQGAVRRARHAHGAASRHGPTRFTPRSRSTASSAPPTAARPGAIAAPICIRLSELPHLKSKIVSDTFAEGMLDGHAITISPADPDAVVLACRMGLFRSRRQGQAAGRTWR